MAYAIAVLVVVSLVCFIAVIVGTTVGAFAGGDAPGAWPAVFMFPGFALPAALLLTIVLLIVSALTRKNRHKTN